MDPAPPLSAGRPDARRAGLAAGLVLAACVGLLALPGLQPRGLLSFGGLAALRTARDLSAFAARLAGWGVLELLRAAPLGFLAVLVFRDRERRRERALRVGLPAAALALAGTAVASWVSGALAPAGFAQLRLLLASAGALAGVRAGLAWRRGYRACFLYGLELVAAMAALGLATSAVAALAIERAPRTPLPAPISSDDKRRLYDLVRGKDPRSVPAGETRTVHLTVTDLDLLSSWGAGITRRGQAVIHVDGPGVASAEASIRVPWPRGYWLNVATRVRLGIEDGRLDLAVQALRVGRLSFPAPALAILSPMLAEQLKADPRTGGVLRAAKLLRITTDGATATWSRVEVPEGSLGGLLWGEDLADVHAHVAAYVSRLTGTLRHAPGGDAGFEVALQTAFAQAREASRDGSAVEENRAALIALGVVLGHHRISSSVGDAMDENRAAALETLRSRFTVRARNDWVRHFTVSGALVALSWTAPSDAAGLFKEERDAAGGSGFSFGDLLADRAGTTFAGLATRDEAAAAAMQERLARGARVEDLFPPAADLPEDIQDAEFQRRYGGVGGPLFRRWAEEIERRVSACAAYRR